MKSLGRLEGPSVMHENRSRHVRTSWLIGMLLLISALVVGASGPVQAKPKGTGAPVCGSTVTADVRLTADMSCSGPGLIVGAAGITIDLNNHQIVGGGTGILNNGFADVTVQDGILRNFAVGVQFTGVNGGLVDNLTMTFAQPIYGVTGVLLDGSQHVTVDNNHISDPSFG